MAGFSARTSWDTSEGALAAAIREARADGRELLDLTVSNPTLCGFDYDADALLAPLAAPASLVYDPDPRGLRRAREAVALYYAAHDARVDPGHLLLTTSTSEAYSFLFRLLADPGDEVLAAQPSYPLFDFLADLDSVRLRAYPLFYDFGWWIDFAELERRITPRTRALLLVHPNNPTGHATGSSERLQLEEICVRHRLALIVDEVFLDYGLEDGRAKAVESFATGAHPCLTFVVSGLSKIAALPQMKVAWLAAFGPAELVGEANARLEVIADTFLSLSAPAQHALPSWLASREAISRQIVARCRENLRALESSGLDFYPVQAGWCAIVRLAASGFGREPAVELLTEQDVIVHDGRFYGLGAGRIVINLIVPPATFAAGLARIAARARRG